MPCGMAYANVLCSTAKVHKNPKSLVKKSDFNTNLTIYLPCIVHF